MSPADVDHASNVLRSREQLSRDRRRRQTYTFVSLFTLVCLVGLVAFGNWQQWWTIGGSAQAATICPVQTVTEPRFTNVNVINGTTRKGLASAVAKELQKRDFRVLTISTGVEDKSITTPVEVRYGAAGALAARTVSLQFPAKVKMVKDGRDEEAVDVVIGAKYKSMVAAPKALAAIKPKEDPRGCVHPTTPAAPTPSAS
jgi:hypothetical protein